MSQKYVSFSVSDNMYAVALADVVRIVGYENVTEVPKAPEYVEGVINLQGAVIPIINMRERFGLPRDDSLKRQKVLVVHVNQRSFGLVVDSVSEIVDVEEEDIERDATAVFGQRAEFTSGIAKLEDSLLIILDPQSVLTQP